MSHSHKGLVKSDSSQILSENYVYEGSGVWRRKTPEQIKDVDQPSLKTVIPRKGLLAKLFSIVRGEA
jgi:hypothetical protein